jgi:putative membrane-bound dehydrogenase-like protein
MHVRVFFAAYLGLLVVSRFVHSADEIQSPLSPSDAQKHFVLADDSLRIELAAAEPEVIDPVAIRFDEDGRMWVAEMRDYPLGPPAGVEPLSKIRILEAKDGDGRFESATTFAEKLPFVNGLQPWKGGVFVTLAGRVAYMKDTDGDGKMDLDETWFEGFAQENSQLRANHPRLALDNHIYVANGLRGGKIVNRRLSDQPVIDISGMDFRFDPLTGKAEAVSGNGQFGLSFDDWGNRFTCTNRNPCRHVVIEDRYLRASPGISIPAVMQDVAAFAENSRIFPISRAWTTSNLHEGTFTAACGVYIYRGDLLPPAFKGNVFTCDPTGNLVHREIMQPAGPTFTSKPAYEGKEFLASKDEWFRPVNLELGPDGALYVVDMYRCVIEHPDFVPDELKNRPDQRMGDDRGRIWRIVPNDTNPKRERGTPDTNPTRQRGEPLSAATSADLVKLLEHPNAWQRETAQRLLLERGRVDDSLHQMVTDGKTPLSRAQSLWLLHTFDALDEGKITASVKDSDALARRQALIVAEQSGRKGIGMVDRLGFALVDANSLVRFQAMLTLSPDAASRKKVTGREVFRVLQPGMDDVWIRRAANLYLDAPQAIEIVDWLFHLSNNRELSAGEIALLEDASELAAGASATVNGMDVLTMASVVLRRAKQPKAALAALTGMSRRWARGQSLPRHAHGHSLLAADRLVTVAKSPEYDLAIQTRAIALLGFAGTDAVWPLAQLAVGSDNQTIRVAAIESLARHAEVERWQPLLDGFASDTPAARRSILDGLLANAERTMLLLDAIEAGRIKPSELDPSQASRMLESRDATIKERAGKLFAAATPEDRVKALADYQPALGLAADATRGRAIFERNCAVCHKIGDLGVNVAPDISDSRTKTAAQLLADILQPNRAIDNNYLGYTVRLLDGTIATGILTTETATSITLRQQGGKDLVVARSEIEEVRSSGVSFMPEGLERQIPQQEMADLLSFIKNWRYLDGKTPLGGK